MKTVEEILDVVFKYVEQYHLEFKPECCNVEHVSGADLVGTYAGSPAYETRYYAITDFAFQNTDFRIIVDEEEDKIVILNEEQLTENVTGNMESMITRETVGQFLEYAYDISDREPEFITLEEYMEE